MGELLAGLDNIVAILCNDVRRRHRYRVAIRSPASTATAAARVLMKVRRNGNPFEGVTHATRYHPFSPSSGCAAKPRPASARRAVRQFDALLARRQAFVILSEEGFDEDGHEHPQEERKRASLWMKRNKAAIRAYIQGMVLVEPSAAKRLAGKAFAVMFGKFWGYPRTSAPAATTRSTSPSICSRPGCRPTMIRQGLTMPDPTVARGRER
jgi:hypothetical protein